jgi:hypothetical protein
MSGQDRPRRGAAGCFQRFIRAVKTSQLSQAPQVTASRRLLPPEGAYPAPPQARWLQPVKIALLGGQGGAAYRFAAVLQRCSRSFCETAMTALAHRLVVLWGQIEGSISIRPIKLACQEQATL